MKWWNIRDMVGLSLFQTWDVGAGRPPPRKPYGLWLPLLRSSASSISIG